MFIVYVSVNVLCVALASIIAQVIILFAYCDVFYVALWVDKNGGHGVL